MKSIVQFLFITLLTILVSCKGKTEKAPIKWNTKAVAEANKKHNQLLEIEKKQGWLLLFNGKTLDGWHLYNNPDSTNYSAWQVKDGMLYCNPTDESKVRGDLVTNRPFKDYELNFEWKISARGNSGVFINVQESPEILQTYHSGPEYQMLDTDHMDYNEPFKSPGCLYGFQEQLNPVNVKPTNQWNTSTIKQKNGKIEFYLNGVLTAKEDFKSSKWLSQVNGSGFADKPEFGKHTEGKIALQNWYFDVWFRNMKIREL
ncbi:3-keto-disaccharide hydrolase [Croceivirga radicis]|uniref:3-keto-disaccharide hydrolase n=1 Tax=Croceivirga radicis TaxID=1929488 RepID=UPI000255AD9F|nr:DUF1080 domain-containing protein [Croceivirga radicis]